MHRLNDLVKDQNKRRVCKSCGRILPRSLEGDICQSCQDEEMYRQVKDYILHHSVTEKELSEIFNIPLSKIHQCVNEGFIEYRPGWK
jgi:RNA polymerase subunit RPABC4/transcription elongation factor Spt4